MTAADQTTPNAVLRCWAEIDLRSLRDNVTCIRNYLGAGREYVAIVKADAYGLGLQAIVESLLTAGVNSFAVANITEAIHVRQLAPQQRIIILSPILPGEEGALVEYNLIPIISSVDELNRLQRLGKSTHQSIPFHLKIDTGMGRLGIHYEDKESLAQLFQPSPDAHLEGICTHFPCADSDVEFTRLQRQRFTSLLDSVQLPERADFLIHADNSAGLDTIDPGGTFNAVRIGLLQFGCAPNPSAATAKLALRPVLSLHTRIGLVKNLPKDASVSYGRTFFTTGDTRIAVLTAGYCDGIPVAASNRAQVLVNGIRCPVIGRVTMDQTIIDVSHLDPASLEVGAIATIVGRQGNGQIHLREFSDWADTIPWEICCSISKRVARITIR